MNFKTRKNLKSVLGDMPQAEIKFYKPINEADI